MKKEAMFWERQEDGLIHCFLCSHNCVIADTEVGFCGVRQNLSGKLISHTYGKVIARGIDPVEKKPLYHFLPGSQTYSIATCGCNLKCSFCQNWQISQCGPSSGHRKPVEISPEAVVREAANNSCRSISYTYTEPTVFFEYAYDISRKSKECGLFNIFVTNGYMTPDVVDTITPYLDAANIDLKFFSEQNYLKFCGGSLDPVITTIEKMFSNGIWLEITTLLINGVNDSEEELYGLASFIADLNKDIPWHISGFRPEYKLSEREVTSSVSIKKAMEIGKKSGLKYVYPGNVREEKNTYCPTCGEMLMRRLFQRSEVLESFHEHKCGVCGSEIAGIWK